MGVLAIAGVPPLGVFDSEWMIFAGGFRTEHVWLAVLSVFGSLLTVAYALWFGGRLLFGSRPEGLTTSKVPWTMFAPTVLLAALAVIEGVIPAPLINWAAQEMNLLLGGNW